MFNFRKSGGAEGPAAPAERPVQKRQSYRAAVEFPLLYVVDGRAGTRSACANDLSVGGLRLLGDEAFPKETMIDFRFTLPPLEAAGVTLEKKRVSAPPTPFEPLEVAGQIVVAFYDREAKRFAHGVRFLPFAQRTEDEIQRFIHLYQRKALRERADREPGV